MHKELPPLTDTFIRAGLTKGWLIPPRDENTATQTDRLFLVLICLMLLFGVICLAIAWLFVVA